MKVTVCIGSSCHLKGSRQVVEEFQHLIAENELQDKVELHGQLPAGRLRNGGRRALLGIPRNREIIF